MDDVTYRGRHAAKTGPIDYIVTLDAAFPFMPPKVLVDPEESVPWSWHRYVDGSMCLYTEDDHGSTPWLDVDSFLVQVEHWIDNTISGWTTDNPDMDLERYFTPSNHRLLVLYADLDRYKTPFVLLRTTEYTATVVGEAKAPPKHRPRHRLYGYMVDIGTPDEPPRTWDQVMTLVGPSDDVTRLVAERLIDVVLVRYRRGGTDGVLALRVRWTADGVLAQAMPAAPNDASVMEMRAGPQRVLLESAHVHLVGGGALGSFIADGLIRAGLGRLTIQDHDVVRPGNLVRHLVGAEQVGMAKGSAIKDYLDRTTYSHCTIEVSSTAMLTLEQALHALRSCHLLIDATANSVATSVLAHAARITGTSILAACLQNDGQTQRVDVIPPMSGSPIPPTLQRASVAPALYEGGCGSPVSPTPPHAVIEAAAMTVAHAVGFLTRSHVSTNGELRDRAAL
ncbi:ThiF family adenylyltransferase [Knoellia locipacati]|uniref:ThiF family adenylyltransferase n=1 Tax=Knoellia locipacati TaxID=882824 RepID=UPI00384BEF1E